MYWIMFELWINCVRKKDIIKRLNISCAIQFYYFILVNFCFDFCTVFHFTRFSSFHVVTFELYFRYIIEASFLLWYIGWSFIVLRMYLFHWCYIMFMGHLYEFIVLCEWYSLELLSRKNDQCMNNFIIPCYYKKIQATFFLFLPNLYNSKFLTSSCICFIIVKIYWLHLSIHDFDSIYNFK